MLGRSGTGFVLGLLMLPLGTSCRDRGSADQDSRPLPTPEPPASAVPAAPRVEPTGVAKKPVVTDEAKPKPVVVTPEPTTATTAAPTTPAAGGAPAAGGTGSGGSPVVVPTAVPTIAAPSAACMSRCQGALQSCLAQPVDGGVPGFANLDICKKAFEACQAACN
jgi:hypothetical protein